MSASFRRALALRRLAHAAGLALALSASPFATAQPTFPKPPAVPAAATPHLPPAFQCTATPLVNFSGTIVDAALQTPELSTLASLVSAAGLVGPLSGPGPLTVFAPTNAAFARIPPTLISAIGSDVPVLTAVLTYHVAPGLVDPRFDFAPREIKTLQGQTLFARVKPGQTGGPLVNQSTLNCRGVRTSNGVVWIIDSVLQPQYR